MLLLHALLHLYLFLLSSLTQQVQVHLQLLRPSSLLLQLHFPLLLRVVEHGQLVDLVLQVLDVRLLLLQLLQLLRRQVVQLPLISFLHILVVLVRVLFEVLQSLGEVDDGVDLLVDVRLENPGVLQRFLLVVLQLLLPPLLLNLQLLHSLLLFIHLHVHRCYLTKKD